MQCHPLQGDVLIARQEDPHLPLELGITGSMLEARAENEIRAGFDYPCAARFWNTNALPGADCPQWCRMVPPGRLGGTIGGSVSGQGALGQRVEVSPR